MAINISGLSHTPAVKSISTDLGKIGQELAEQLSPKAVNPKIKRMLERISDLSAFKYLEKIPENRFKNSFANSGDVKFQQEIQKLIKIGLIKPQTMIISSTGHDIPMLAQLHKNDHLKFNSAFHLKFQKDGGNISRISGQTLTWGNEIKQAESKTCGQTNGLFLGIEGHRDWKTDTAKLPSSQELKESGITRVVHLVEGNPTKTFLSENTRELQEYYKTLEHEGIEVFYKGVDSRQFDNATDTGMYKVPYNSLYAKSVKGPSPLKSH